MPELTIILASYNRPLGLDCAIDSVRGQGGDLECIICDDGSTDEHVHRLIERTLQADNRFRAFHHESRTPQEKQTDVCTFGAMLNHALLYSHSDFVTYINDAVEYKPGRCTQLINYLKAHRHVDACWGQQEMVRYGRDGSPVHRRNATPDDTIVQWQGDRFMLEIADHNFIDHSSVMERRKVSQRVKWSTDPAHWTCTDWIRWQECAGLGMRFDFVGRIVGEVKHVMPDSLGTMISEGASMVDVVNERGG